MPAAPITFKNVGQIDFASGNTAAKNAISDISAGLASITDVAKQFADKQKADNTATAINAIHKIGLGQVDNAINTNAFTKANLPGNIDLTKVTTALTAQKDLNQKNFLNQQVFDNKLKDINATKVSNAAYKTAESARQNIYNTNQKKLKDFGGSINSDGTITYPINVTPNQIANFKNSIRNPNAVDVTYNNYASIIKNSDLSAKRILMALDKGKAMFSKLDQLSSQGQIKVKEDVAKNTSSIVTDIANTNQEITDFINAHKPNETLSPDQYLNSVTASVTELKNKNDNIDPNTVHSAIIDAVTNYNTNSGKLPATAVQIKFALNMAQEKGFFHSGFNPDAFKTILGSLGGSANSDIMRKHLSLLQKKLAAQNQRLTAVTAKTIYDSTKNLRVRAGLRMGDTLYGKLNPSTYKTNVTAAENNVHYINDALAKNFSSSNSKGSEVNKGGKPQPTPSPKPSLTIDNGKSTTFNIDKLTREAIKKLSTKQQTQLNSSIYAKVKALSNREKTRILHATSTFKGNSRIYPNLNPLEILLKKINPDINYTKSELLAIRKQLINTNLLDTGIKNAATKTVNNAFKTANKTAKDKNVADAVTALFNKK